MSTVHIRNLPTELLESAQMQLQKLIDAQAGGGSEPDEMWAWTRSTHDLVEEWEAFARKKIREAA